MKQIIFGLAIIAASLSACSDNNSQSKDANTSSDTAETTTQAGNADANQQSSVNEVLAAYLQLKNALANDNGKDAATAGKQISEALQKIDEASLTGEQKKMFADVKDNMKEHSEHIAGNADKIEHQREHFDMLSKDMYDLVKTFGSGQTLYQTYCPMYNDNKGATWLSETKEIKNPYLGKKMPDCGTVKEVIKQ